MPCEDLDPYAFRLVAILGKVTAQPVQQNHSVCSRIWFWDLVAMLSQISLCLPNLPNLLTQPFNQILHRNLSNLNLHAWLLEPQLSRSRATQMQWQHELRLLRVSSRSVYDSKWTILSIFTKWCLSNQVDSGHHPTSVAHFLLYLFKVRKLQPSTINDYRPTVADKLGNFPVNVSKDENLTGFLNSFHRDRPREASHLGTFPWCCTI